MVFEYIHPSGIKLRPARPLTNSILCIYNPIGNEWMHLCKEDIHGHLELLTCFSNGATMYQVIEGLKKVVEYWGDDYLVGRRDFYKEIIDITPTTSQGLALLSSYKCLEAFTWRCYK